MLLDELKLSLSESLQRKGSTTCSRWSENYIILGKPVPGPMRFWTHPWSREWCDQQDNWVGKKAAQMGMTNACLARALFTIDIKRNDVLYILPKRSPDATDFSKAKFDVLLDLSPHLRTMFSNVRNVGHKQSGNVNFFLRGSRSRSALKSISVGLQIYDEYDEMSQKNLSLAEERSSGYTEEDIQKIKISTPTIPEFGISKEFKDTDDRHYVFQCPNCGKWTELDPIKSLVIPTDDARDRDALSRSYLKCIEPNCGRPLDHTTKKFWLGEKNAHWTATQKGNSLPGYWIHSLYSIVRPLGDIAKKVLEARDSEIANIELHNSVYARDYVPEGSKVSEQQVEACRGNYRNGSIASAVAAGRVSSPIVTMGVDVGHKQLYCHIDEWLLPPNPGANINTYAIPRTLYIGTVAGYNDLAHLMSQYQILHCIVDVDPETRSSVDFAEAFQGHVNLCRFHGSAKKRNIKTEDSSDGLIVQVNRNTWLDTSQSRYLKPNRGGIILPQNPPIDYGKHISALVKQLVRDDEGNLKARYVNTGPDHYAFARVYSEISLPFAISLQTNQNIALFL